MAMEHVHIFLIFTFLVESYGIIDYTENTELIQQRAGYDITLRCDLKGLIDDDKMIDVKIHWYFKQCSDSEDNTSSCRDFQNDDWTQLPCEENFCKTDLLLRNVTERYSGLYKCTVYPHRSIARNALDIQLVRTYQLDVKNTSMAVPEFLDAYPLNKTAAIGAQVVFQCRVHSEVHPTIKWFRRYNAHNAPIKSEFQYNGRTYELLPTAREKFIADEIYLSKLILNGVRLQDEGFYACAAISYRGYRIREAYLEVYANEEMEYWADYDDSDEGRRSEPGEFWMLFLMPLGLAMLPLSVWLCYVIYRRCKPDARVKRVEQPYSVEEDTADHYMLRT